MSQPELKIAGSLLGNAQVVSIEVRQQLNAHWSCTIICHQGVGERIGIEGFLGKPVQVTGVDENGAQSPVFTGFVLSSELIYEPGGAYSAQLTAVSQSWKMDVKPHKRYYLEQTLAQVAATVAPLSGVTATVNAPAQKKLNYVQYAETDFAFLHRIVDDYGAWLRPTPTGIEVWTAFQHGTTVQWRDKADLVDFRLSGTLAPASFDGAHYDHHTMMSQNFHAVTKAAQFYGGGSGNLTDAVASQSKSLLPSGFVFDRSRTMENSEFQQVLEEEAVRSIGGSIFGMGRTRNPALTAGNELTIAGSLDAAGTYGLIQVTHLWTREGYTNTFVCTPWKDYRNPSAPATREWAGVVPARVVDHNDPKKMGRIKVQFFWQEDGATHWARATAPHAGPGRGFMFLPEVGDEVAVAFEDGDPERPLIVGSLWNGVQQAPRAGYFSPEADIPSNNVKRIYTKSGNRLQLVDSPGQETVALATPNHTLMTMSENHGATSRPLVHVHSDGDILLTAPNGRVHIQGLIFTQEIGDPSQGTIPAAGKPAALPPVNEEHSWLGGFALGLFDSTLGALGSAIAHPVKTVEGLGHAVMHPIETTEAIGTGISKTAKGIASGDGYAAGTAVGTVGMVALPFAGEAGAAADTAEVAEVGGASEATAEAGSALPEAANDNLPLAANDNVPPTSPIESPSAPANNNLPVAEGQTVATPDPGASRLIPGQEPNFNPTNGNTNCGACSNAVDNYLGGKDFAPAANTPFEWPENAPGDSPNWNWDTNASDINSTLAQGGDGSKGIVYVQDGSDAHVFNAYNSDGNIMAFDGQNGASGSITDVASKAGYTNPQRWSFHPTGK